MAKLIKETTTRLCCAPQDLLRDPLHPEREYVGGPFRFQVCRHCGQRFERYGYVDAAGSRDYDYRPMKA